MGKVAAGEVRGRVGLFPGDGVEDFEAELLHGVANRKYDVVGAGHPNGAIGLENALVAAQPFGVELVI